MSALNQDNDNKLLENYSSDFGEAVDKLTFSAQPVSKPINIKIDNIDMSCLLLTGCYKAQLR